MKTKNRNLLTVILAMLCAAAVALGIGFLLPKAEKIDANAQTLSSVSTTFTPGTFTSISGAFTNGLGWGNGAVTDTVTLKETTNNSSTSSAEHTFNIGIAVPAYTQYTVKYEMEAIAYNYNISSPTPFTTGNFRLERYKEGTYSTLIQTYAQHSWAIGTNYYDNYHFFVNDVIFTNDTGAPQTYTAYFKFIGNVITKSASVMIAYGVGYAPSLTQVEVTELPVPDTNDTLTYTYDGNPHTVNFTYADPDPLYDSASNSYPYISAYNNVTVTVDTAISASDYTTTPASLSTATGSGSITVTKAGTYTIKFKLKTSAISNNITWDDGSTTEKTIIIIINKKQLTVPEIVSPDKQTYDGNAQTFTLDTNFDSTAMKMDGVTPDDVANVVTGPGGMGLTVTSNTFQATNAGKYTVNINLKDTDNCEWADGTTAAKTAKFEIEKRDLVTGITSNKLVLGVPKWGLGTNGVQMTVTLDKAYNEYPALKFYYADNPANVLTVASSTDTEIVVDMPTTIPVGLYNFNIALDSAADTGYNKNYKVEAPYNSIAFTVTNTESAIAYYNGDEISATINEEYDGNGKIARSDISIKGVVTNTSVTDFSVTYYKGTTPTVGNELAPGELPKDAGDYCVKITLGTAAANIFTLANDEFVVSISPKKIVAPTLGSANLVFNGLTQNISDLLKYDKDVIEMITTDSVLEGYHADTYSVYFKIKDEYKDNYIFVLPENAKSAAKKSVTTEQPSYSVTLSDDDKSAQLDWNIQKYVYDTTIPSAWNFTKEGAALSFKGVPASIVALTTGPNPTLIFEVNYYDQSYNALSEVTLEGGNKYYVAASLADCADRNDIVFKNQTYDNGIGRDISPHASYTVPKAGGMATFFNKVKDFMTDVKVGMPVWCWFLIALAALILLIIIIVVACKRRKSKEEREAKKAAKEEEKARLEEERRRKEEERAEEKRRRDEEREEEKRRREEERAEEKRRREEQLEHEREMAKAKQEAELEKIKAQAAANAGMAGMASMAMAQPQQQAMPVPPQPVQQVQSVDNELLKEMRQQMAELRADNKATQAQLQAMQNSQNQPQPMQYPMYPQYQQMPMMPQYPQMPNYGGGNDMALARMEAQLNAMQAEQRARYDAEQRIELAAMRAESHVDRDSRHSVDLAAMREHINGHNYNRVLDYSQQSYNQPNSMDMMGALVAATLRNMANGELAATQSVPELPQKTETATPAAKYPSDAVITTTTTVDTTKNGAIRRDENFDIDGFYDPLD